jgi:hypothetical protein
MLDGTNINLSDIVIQLHDIARMIEQEIGQGNLSDDVRNCANRVNALIKQQVTHETL